MDRAELVAFVRRRGRAVLGTRGPDDAPRATPATIAVTDDAEIIFETSTSSAEYRHIQADPLVALLIGDEGDVTVQAEGTADVLTGPDRDRCLRAYFQQYPAGRPRASNPGVTHLRVVLRRVRLTDYRPDSYGSQEIELSS
jgi:PPOX class probable F420-dependent enzyme